MKKFKILLSALALLLCFASCSSCNSDKQEEEEVTSLEFNALIQEDVNYAIDNFNEPVFYEAQIKFDKPITSEEYPNVIEVLTVIQDIDTTGQYWCYLFQHTLEGCVIDSVNSPWLEDCVINLDSVKLTLEEALDRLYGANIVLPESSVAVLRRPLGPQLFIYPFYIFGQMDTGFVEVNAGTGEVNLLEYTEIEECDEDDLDDTLDIE
jgi:hypothetical protein